MEHSFKIWPQYYEAVVKGIKTFELRKGRFSIGDTLKLKEVEECPCGISKETGRILTVIVTYVFKGGRFGVSKKWNVLGIDTCVHPKNNDLTSRKRPAGRFPILE